MTTLAIGSSVTLTVKRGGTVAVSSNGGLGSITVVETGGSSVTSNFGPDPLRRQVGPLALGGTVTITNSSCNALDYNGDGATAVAGVGTPYVLAQTAVPVILPSSGSSNASGQITLGTALPYVPAGIVSVYLPAGVVTGGSQGSGAGLYQAQFSSTTVCQLTGTGIVTANAAYTQTTATPIPLAAVTVPGNAMGANGALRVTSRYSSPANTNSKPYYTQYGGTTFSSPGGGGATVVGFTVLCNIRNRNAANSQIGDGDSGGLGTMGVRYFGSVDSTVAQPLTLLAAITVATDFIILEGYTVEVLPAN